MGDAGGVTSHQATPPSFAQRERQQLCLLFDRLGPSAPTLCEGWLTKDLLAHLVLREGHPAALGIAVKPLARWQNHVQENLTAQPFPDLVDRLRDGPPWFSPLHPRKVDAAVNSLELFVHHEDVRRAQPTWQPRSLSDRDQNRLWRALQARGKYFVRNSPVGVTLDDSSGDELTIRERPVAVTLTGEPAELVLYLHGRQDHANVSISGDVDDVELFTSVELSL